MSRSLGWAPAAVLVAGAVLATLGVQAQRTLPLRASLAGTVPNQIAGLVGHDIALSKDEAQAVAVTSYLVRDYRDTGGGRGAGFNLYVGYYDRQTQGRTIHSPKNCLPGAGWEPLESRPETLTTAAGLVTVNRYLLQRHQERALVLYWYQGRGRVAWNEYRVKWDLLRDAALRRRSDEALVRIVVRVDSSEVEALRTARFAAAEVVRALGSALPG